MSPRSFASCSIDNGQPLCDSDFSTIHDNGGLEQRVSRYDCFAGPRRHHMLTSVLDKVSHSQKFKMPITLCTSWLVLTLLLLSCRLGSAQSTQETQFLPEIDAYIKLNPNVRVVAQAKDTRDGGEPIQAEIGPGIEYYAKPLIRLKEITRFDLDDAKARPLVLTAGYRFLSSPTSPSTNRIPLAATSRLPLKAKLLMNDRNRADLDWSNGSFTWRYRNMLTVERTLTIHSYHPIPYVSAEFYYESQYQKWSTTELYAGFFLPMGKHFELKPYYEHQNNTGKYPNKQLHGLGLTLNIYVSRKSQ